MQLQSFVTELSRRRCPAETRCFLKQQKTQRVDWLKTEARFQSDGTISHQSSTVLAWCGNTKAQAGEGFYEEPGAHHRVQRNGSETSLRVCWRSSSSMPMSSHSPYQTGIQTNDSPEQISSSVHMTSAYAKNAIVVRLLTAVGPFAIRHVSACVADNRGAACLAVRCETGAPLRSRASYALFMTILLASILPGRQFRHHDCAVVLRLHRHGTCDSIDHGARSRGARADRRNRLGARRDPADGDRRHHDRHRQCRLRRDCPPDGNYGRAMRHRRPAAQRRNNGPARTRAAVGSVAVPATNWDRLKVRGRAGIMLHHKDRAR
jgi:hypothetical protein